MHLSENEKIGLLLARISCLLDANDVDNFLQDLFQLEGVVVIGFVNAHAVNLCVESESFMRALSASNFLLRDGVGLELLLAATGASPGVNMNGTDFIPLLIREAIKRHICIHVIGTEAPFNSCAAEGMREEGALIGCVEHGFHAVEDYPAFLRPRLREKNLVILGMGMPKQELVAASLKDDLVGESVIVVNGGAILDFLGGRVTRAPVWMRRLRLEWLYRLALEPRRMWRRYLLGNAIFLWRSFFYKLGLMRR